MEFGGNEDDESFKTVRLRDRLNEADTERRKDEDAAALRERAAEIKREERLAKIAYMENMDDATPAGTGKYSQWYQYDSFFFNDTRIVANLVRFPIPIV